MQPLINQGFKLALYGMGTVFVFLTLLVFAIYLMARILREDSVVHENKGNPAVPNATKAAIIGAIHQHRKKKIIHSD